MIHMIVRVCFSTTTFKLFASHTFKLFASQGKKSWQIYNEYSVIYQPKGNTRG